VVGTGDGDVVLETVVLTTGVCVTVVVVVVGKMVASGSGKLRFLLGTVLADSVGFEP